MNFTFIAAEMWEYGPKTVKILNSGHKFTSFAQFLRNSQHLYMSLGRFLFLIWSLSGDNRPSYDHFAAVGAFSHKFSIAPSGETADQIKKKVSGVQKWHGPPL